jgi:beta-glucosidase
MAPVSEPDYLDPTRDVDRRVDDLVARMTIEEKAGQLFHTMALVGPGGELAGPLEPLGLPAVSDLVLERSMTHFNMLGSALVGDLAVWHNRLQDLALETRLQIPITVSTDPRHAFTENTGTGAVTAAFSEWPEALGLAAIGDEGLVERFADICRQEYLAVGLRVALHPQLDVATEPRWARIASTFGEDADLVARLGAAYVRGFRGDRLGPESVATMVKHFPGGAPLRDGEDSHFTYGREQIYPADNLDYHLAPFRTAIEAGASQVMPSYGMPVGTDYDEIGCGLNRSLVAGLLRDDLGFDGIVCTDWGLITDGIILGQEMPARAWGAEHLTPSERICLALDAGVDQFGGEYCSELIVGLVRSGSIDESRIDRSARRLMREKFRLGLFDRRHVDVEAAREVAGAEPFRAAGRAAQSRSVTVLTSGGGRGGALPLAEGCRVFLLGVDADIASDYASVVDDRADADVTLMRLAAPYEERTGGFERMFHAGSLEFQVERMDEILAVLTDIAGEAAALTVTYGCGDAALLDAWFGRVRPEGRLPVDLPRSMEAVRASAADAPFDTADPVFRFGHNATPAT